MKLIIAIIVGAVLVVGIGAAFIFHSAPASLPGDAPLKTQPIQSPQPSFTITTGEQNYSLDSNNSFKISVAVKNSSPDTACFAFRPCSASPVPPNFSLQRYDGQAWITMEDLGVGCSNDPMRGSSGALGTEQSLSFNNYSASLVPGSTYRLALQIATSSAFTVRQDGNANYTCGLAAGQPATASFDLLPDNAMSTVYSNEFKTATAPRITLRGVIRVDDLRASATEKDSSYVLKADNGKTYDLFNTPDLSALLGATVTGSGYILAPRYMGILPPTDGSFFAIGALTKK